MIVRETESLGISVAAIAQGTWSMGGDKHWGPADDENSIHTIRTSLEQGINLIDTAPVYGFGSSEQLVGKAMKPFDRSKVLVQTKCGLHWREEEGTFHMERDGKILRRNLTGSAIRRGLEESLINLDTEYVDILMTHEQAVEPLKTPISETMGTLLELKKEGKIRAIGVSNCSREQLLEYLKYGPVDVVQEKFSMLDIKKAKELMDLCQENKILFEAYSPLEQGLLSGGIGPDYVVPEGHVRSRNPWFLPERRSKVWELLEGWRSLCRKYQCSMTALVTAWTCAFSSQMVVLAGGSKAEHMADYIEGGLINLDEKDLEEMNREIGEVTKAFV